MKRLAPTELNVLTMLKESNAIEDVFDAQSLKDSYEAWDYIMDYQLLTRSALLATHAILMKNQNIDLKYKGDYRDVSVTIGGETKSLPKIVINTLIEDLVNDMNASVKEEDAIMYHLRFESIHPFYDGNGRLGRILLNWFLVKRFNEDLMVFEHKNKEEYYELFR